MIDETLPPEMAMEDKGPTDEQLADPGGYDLTPLDDDRRAEWAMRRLRRARDRILDATLQHDAWIRPIRDWYDDVTAADRRIVQRLEASLEAYALMVRVRTNEKVKTVKLPSGEILTAGQKEPTVLVEDEELVMKWADDSLDADTYERVIKNEPRPLISELRKVVRIRREDDGTPYVLDLDGNRVPGVNVEEPKVTAKVKPKATDDES